MAIRVYNSLSRKKEAFVPLHGKRVWMFVCGITPQDQTHMGHAKTYVAFDVVARFLRHKGYHVFYLQNVTDIEDRIIGKMNATGRPWTDIVAEYFAEYRDVMNRLRCTSVDVYAFATDYMDEIVGQIAGLIEKGHAYVADDKSVYFDTTTFAGWGKPRNPESQRGTAHGARGGQDGTSRTRPSRFGTLARNTICMAARQSCCSRTTKRKSPRPNRTPV